MFGCQCARIVLMARWRWPAPDGGVVSPHYSLLQELSLLEMKTFYRIFKKELATYFDSPQAYIFLVVFLIAAPALFFNLIGGGFFKAQQASLGGFFSFLPWMFLFLCPAISMRIWSEEKKSGTEELLMTMPVRDWEVVLGKYFSTLFLLLVALLLTLPLVYVVKRFADDEAVIDWAPVWCGYLGAFLMGASILAIGCWASSTTVNQIVAFIITCAVTFLLIMVGLPAVGESLPSGVAQAMSNFSLMTHFVSMYRGVIELSDVVYFVSLILFFLFLNVRFVESRKWK
jgi:ABC-2 type transport system permease protein